MTARGYLSPIKVRLSNFTLVVQTGVGIQNCGFDESAYAYEWSEKAWRRFWQSEQNDYVDERYRPQSLIDVLVSSNDEKSGEHLILTLGIHSWCTSNFQGVYYRVWQTRSIASPPRLLLDETGPAMLRFWPPIKGRLATLDDRIGAADDVLVEYTVFGHANGIMDREEVRHYRLRQDRLERVDPIALSPANFVDVWLAMDGPARSGWTDPQTRERLRHWRSSAVPDGSERFGQASHCEQKPDAWQEVFFGDSIGKAAATYFLVRWRPPFHFTMLDISDHPFPGCTEKDPEADQFRSLFR